MTDLIACLSSGKGTCTHVFRVIGGMEWGKVFLIVNDELRGKFENKFGAELIHVDASKTISELAAFIKLNLQGKISDLEVGLNIVSGSGKEHMAVIQALLELGFGIRLVALTEDGVKTL